MAVTVRAQSRENKTKGEINEMRKQGMVPAVVYGKKVGVTPIAIDQKEFMALLRGHRHAIIEMEIPQVGKQPVMINEVQRDKLTRELLHIDFHQINMDEPVKTVVALDFEGEAVGVKEGGILQIQRHDIEIRCLPQNIPTSVKVDVSRLGIGDNMLVGDLTLPEEIELKSDPSELLVTILMPQKEEPAAEVVAEETEGKTVASEGAVKAALDEAGEKSTVS
ncbi:50S ribosomal protein L25 [Paenibacillus hamazuiensis]|uniref:50S ribosomal protein L25 n=1 Tax=Paenibacillus hamazuiensis TaxID=2936508 RepID=UPI00200C7E70|nr:50S ribosomal protein L25 [Paenibacillus hamazuiensis]